VITRGRWVRCPPGTPAFPGYTWLGSRDWTSDDYFSRPPLGEVDGPVRKWDNGQPPVVFPPAALIGSARCLAEGERPGDVTPGLIDGFDVRCWALARPVPEPILLRVDITYPPHQIALADSLTWIYASTMIASDKLVDFMGPGTVTTSVPNTSSLFPGTVIARQGNVTVVVISGTSNPQQLSMQVLGAGIGPLERGGLGTNSLWWAASNVILDRILASGADPDGPIVLVGHSYGGAVAALVAARLRQWNRTRSIQLLTFGAPKPGDNRLIHRISTVTQVAFVNTDDPVPQIPPGGRLLTMLSAYVPEIVRPRWGAWVGLRGRVALTPEGGRIPQPPAEDLFPQVRSAVVNTLANQPVPEFLAHDMAEYARRLGLIPPESVDVITGSILPFAAATTPAGYLPCDGAAVSRTTYANLFATIGVAWGPGDGSTTFNVPDLRGRSPIGDGQGAGLTLRVLGQSGGEEEHALTIAELPSHDHNLNLKADTVVGTTTNVVALGNAQTSTFVGKTDGTGGNSKHNTMHPYGVVHWVIKT